MFNDTATTATTAEVHGPALRGIAEEILKVWTEFVDEETADQAHSLAADLKKFADRIDPR